MSCPGLEEQSHELHSPKKIVRVELMRCPVLEKHSRDTFLGLKRSSYELNS